MIRYSIKDLEKISGIKAHTIRIWEKRYNLISPSRTSTNIRFYNDEDLRRILNVSILNRYGFRISNIVSMSRDEVSQKLVEISNVDSSFTHEVESLVLAMIEMDESRFDKILSSSIIKFGFETTITGILSQFLEKIGILWQTGTITPAQEHFVSNLIRQKLILAIDGQLVPVKEKTLTFLLFLPEEEFHELGLLYCYYLIKKAGHKVLYLGQNVPMADLSDISGIKPFNFLMTSFTCAYSKEGLQELLDKLSSSFPDKTILIGGYQFHEFKPRLAANMKLMNSTLDVENFLKNIQ
jgi:MerR family transcriptional regulator, light-induced transcriptional regulator